MCGIVGAVAQRNVTGILIEGLKRLEYRGYDSAGVAVLAANKEIEICPPIVFRLVSHRLLLFTVLLK